jgi:hypothetical protein
LHGGFAALDPGLRISGIRAILVKGEMLVSSPLQRNRDAGILCVVEAEEAP